ncbi:unnamed protein product, partial [Symbiodinium necroappetens]
AELQVAAQRSAETQAGANLQLSFQHGKEFGCGLEEVPALPNEAEPENAAEQTEAVAAAASSTEAEGESPQ